MADENQGPGLFDVPEDPLYIRTPRVKLVGTAIAFLFLIIGMPLMLIFVAPIWAIIIYCIVLFSKVWAAYKYSRILLWSACIICLALTYVLTFTVFFVG